MCNFNFNLPVEPAPLLAMVARKVEEYGGVVKGDAPNISISIPSQVGRLEGRCKAVGGNTVNIVVTKKPDVITCNMVRERLVFFITEAVKMYAAESAPAK